MAFCLQFHLRDVLFDPNCVALLFSLAVSFRPPARLGRHIVAFVSKFATDWMAISNFAVMFVLYCHTNRARFTLHQNVAVKLGKIALRGLRRQFNFLEQQYDYS